MIRPLGDVSTKVLNSRVDKMDVGEVLSSHCVALVLEDLEELNIVTKQVMISFSELPNLPGKGLDDLVQCLFLLRIYGENPLTNKELCPPSCVTGASNL